MPYYLRFLKSPTMIDYDLQSQHNTNKIYKSVKNAHKRGQVKLHLTFTCQTDLGDAYYHGNVLILVRLVQSTSSKTQIACGKIEWKQGDRVRSDLLVLERYQDLNPNGKLWVLLEAETHKNKTAYTSYGDMLSARSIPGIISVLAPLLVKNQVPELDNGSHLERHVLRRFFLLRYFHVEKNSPGEKDQDIEVHIYEEMGESIARHIWDAALGLLASCIEQADPIETPKPNAQQQHQISDLLAPFFDISVRNIKDSLEILELGSGCGIVGLGLARLVPNAQFTLTDLAEAMEILDENVLQTTKLGLAPSTSVATKVLDWNWALENKVSPVADSDGNDYLDLAKLHPDLVLVSDCTYNSDSFQALVATLLQVVKQGHKHRPRGTDTILDVLVSYKSRHESESQFFKDMLNAGFHILTKNQIEFPDQTRKLVGLDTESAEIFAFTWRG